MYGNPRKRGLQLVAIVLLAGIGTVFLHPVQAQLGPGNTDRSDTTSGELNEQRSKNRPGGTERTKTEANRDSGKKQLRQAYHESVQNHSGQIHSEAYAPGEQPLVKNADIKVFRSSGAVVIPAQVVQRDVVLEVFLCAENGKSHESLLLTRERAKKMNLSLIMAGFKPEENPAGTGPQYLGDPALPGGDSVAPFVEWQLENGRWVRYRAENLIRNLEEEIVMRRVGFTFAGSYFIENQSPNRNRKSVFAASRIKTLIALFHDPSAILDVPVPQGGLDGIYKPRSEVLPPKGTDVRLILKRPTTDEQEEMERNIADSKKAWSDRKEQLKKKQERMQKSQ